jgi:hypothetical protein
MWKKIYSAVFVCLVCVAFAAVAAAAELPAADVKDVPAQKPERIELVLVLDKSGSMSGLESDTIGGFKESLIK